MKEQPNFFLATCTPSWSAIAVARKREKEALKPQLHEKDDEQFHRWVAEGSLYPAKKGARVHACGSWARIECSITTTYPIGVG
jgi:hypothetical protein